MKMIVTFDVHSNCGDNVEQTINRIQKEVWENAHAYAHLLKVEFIVREKR